MRRLVVTAGLSVGLLSCGGDSSTPAANPDSSVGVADVSTVPCTGCAADEGCVSVKVTRIASDAELPWKTAPTQADGIGTLVVTAVPRSKPMVRKSVPNADFRAAGSQKEVSLGCVPAEKVSVWVYLDDNGDSAADAYYSDNYRDTCLDARFVAVDVVAGKTTKATTQLAASCD